MITREINPDNVVAVYVGDMQRQSQTGEEQTFMSVFTGQARNNERTICSVLLYDGRQISQLLPKDDVTRLISCVGEASIQNVQSKSTHLLQYTKTLSPSQRTGRDVLTEIFATNTNTVTPSLVEKIEIRHCSLLSSPCQHAVEILLKDRRKITMSLGGADLAGLMAALPPTAVETGVEMGHLLHFWERPEGQISEEKLRDIAQVILSSFDWGQGNIYRSRRMR